MMLKVYQGLGAVVRIHRDHPDIDVLTRTYIKNLVYHGWDYENEDIKIFTDLAMAKRVDHPFVPLASVIDPIKGDFVTPEVMLLAQHLEAAEREGFLTVIHSLQPIVWAYCE